MYPPTHARVCTDMYGTQVRKSSCCTPALACPTKGDTYSTLPYHTFTRTNTQLFEAYACQLRLLPLPHNPMCVACLPPSMRVCLCPRCVPFDAHRWHHSPSPSSFQPTNSAAADKASSKHHPSSSSSSSPHPISSLLLGDKDDALRLALWLTLHNLLTLHGVIERFSSSSSSFSIPPGKVNSCKQQSSPSSLQAPLQEMRRAVRYRLFEAENEEGVLTLSPSRIETHLLRLPPSFSSHEGANAATASTSTSRLLPSFLLSSGKDGGEEDEEKEGKWKRQLALRSLEPLAVFGLWDGRGGSGGVRLR